MTAIILGPPGTGKTTKLLSLVEADLEAKIAPERMAYVTFTRKGADEAIERACKKFSMSREQFPYFRTLHSLCYRQLGLRSSEVLVGKSFYEFADYARIRVTGRSWSDDGLLTGFEVGDRILFMENLSRIRRVSLREQYERGGDDGLDWSEVERVAKALKVYKSKHGLMDYTDMLSEFVAQDTPPGLDALYVDEAQDLSALQWQVVALLARGVKKVTVAGDDDQAIYRWAGADVEHLVRMAGQVQVLGQSYRVPPAVQAVANGIIDPVRERRVKAWRAKQGGDGVVERSRTFDDVGLSEEGSILVLARNIYVLREQVEPELRREGVIYEKNGGSSIDLSSLRAVAAWEDLRADRAVPLGEVRKMYEYISANTGVKRGYKKLPKYGDDSDEPITMRDLVQTGGLLVNPKLVWHEALDKLPAEEMSYMLAARRRGERLRGGKPRVRLSTIHSAKGGEADHVVLMSEIAKRTWAEMENNVDDERRTWYVGVTRARERLSIVSSDTNRECPWL